MTPCFIAGGALVRGQRSFDVFNWFGVHVLCKLAIKSLKDFVGVRISGIDTPSSDQRLMGRNVGKVVRPEIIVAVTLWVIGVMSG